MLLVISFLMGIANSIEAASPKRHTNPSCWYDFLENFVYTVSYLAHRVISYESSVSSTNQYTVGRNSK